MIALATVFVVVVVSLLITRVATVALILTGLSRESARFQARSALSGTGFTTSEAENVVNHPVRRRVVQTLMILGSAGLVTAIAGLMLSFVGASAHQAQVRLLALAGGLIALLLVARNAWVDRRLSLVIGRLLGRWTDIDARDYAQLLHLSGGYGVTELAVKPDSWVAERTLRELELREEGVIVLGIERGDGRYVGAPGWATEVGPHDVLIAYGPSERLCELDARKRGPDGDRAHSLAVAEQARRRENDELATTETR